MMNIKVDKDKDQERKCRTLVSCPECGQKLFDARYVSGVVTIRQQCRRCHTFINIDIAGND